MSGAAIRQAVILAGGKGTRLGAITRTVPKPMLPIAGGRPFLDYLLEMIERHGYQDILLLAGYLGEALEAAYGGRRTGGATIRVLREPVPLGTAGALTVAREALDPRFLMMNGDAFFDINLRALEQDSHQDGAMATLALRSVPDAARYGRVIEERGRVVAFLEKDSSQPGPGVINGGVYVLNREILDLVRDLPCSLEQDVFPTLVQRGQIRGREFDGYFLDIGLPETLEQGHLELPMVRVRPAAFFVRSALASFAESDSFWPEGFQWAKGAVEAIRALNDRGYYVCVMSDQSGDLQRTGVAGDGCRLNAAMQERLAPEGTHIDRFYREPEFATGVAPEQAIDAAKRKPDASLLLEAMNEWPIVAERSFFVGVSDGDVEAARIAGISGHVFDGGDLARLIHSLLEQSAQDSAALEPRKPHRR
jgi:dTDP-glucose pyrophosphorylase/histidinol phosphatase-like enzyme